jgi:predicted ester cyclase
MTRAAIEARLADHHLHFERRDADGLAADHAPRGSFTSPAHGTVHGRPAIREVYRYWYGGFPDFTLTWDAPIIEGDQAAVFWHFEGTAVGPFFGMVAAGSRVVMDGAGWYVFGEEGILSVRHVFDFSGVLVKAGVLKIKPT